MLSNVGTGIPGSIDPNLDRETTDNGKKWAVKRARTSFSGGRKKKSVRRISKETQLILDKGPSGTGEMPLSDSEKVLPMLLLKLLQIVSLSTIIEFTVISFFCRLV